MRASGWWWLTGSPKVKWVQHKAIDTTPTTSAIRFPDWTFDVKRTDRDISELYKSRFPHFFSFVFLKKFQNEIRHRRKTHGQRKASGSLEKRLMASFKIDIPGISQFLHHLAGRQMDMFLRKTILSGQMMRPRALRDT